MASLCALVCDTPAAVWLALIIMQGPNALSVNDASELLNIYGAKHHMAKPDAYKIPGRNTAHAMFFQQTREVHATRKQIWQQAFTPAQYVNLSPALSFAC